ncbi:MAG: thermonuclease family protein [Isosphaeraceae bacterium]
MGITDGDTLTVLTIDKKEVRILARTASIAWRPARDFGSRAEQRPELAFDQAVVVKERDTDRYGRTVAEVLAAGRGNR